MILKIEKVKPLKNYRLYVTFNFGIKAIYDANFLLTHEQFKDLRKPDAFNKVEIIDDGEWIKWNDNMCLHAEELFDNGIEAK